MSARQHTLTLPQPLREVRLAAPAAPPAPGTFSEEQLRAAEQAAYERGRRDGEQALSGQLLQQRAELVELQNGVLAALRAAVPQVVRDTEQAVTELALAVAQKLVAGLPVSAESVAAAVREALAQVEETTDFHIYVHPADLELLQRANSDLLTPTPGAAHLYFHASPEVSRGGALVKTRFGVIDARRETKTGMLRKSLLG
jgi:flagellar biosynthesis/type III secretory pathway protein FliH